jgi:primosomal protein N' (replication factor Y)
MAAVTGDRRAVDAALRRAALPDGVERLGPLPFGDDAVRVLLRGRLDQGQELAASLAAMKAVRSAHKEGVGVQVRMQPPDLAS